MFTCICIDDFILIVILCLCFRVSGGGRVFIVFLCASTFVSFQRNAHLTLLLFILFCVCIPLKDFPH